MDIVERLNSDRTPSPIPEIFFADGIVFWVTLILTTPVITMRTFAAEKALGTYEALMTTPVGEWQVVLAKFTGSLAFYLLSWAPLIGVLVVLRQVTHQPQLLDPGRCAGCSRASPASGRPSCRSEFSRRR
jgi:ABC-2 type transport system permease protein